LNGKRLPLFIAEALGAGATLLCATSQRQAAIRTAWAEEQRASGLEMWPTPPVFTFPQFAERRLRESWDQAQLPDRLLPPAAEWAALREWRRDSGGTAEARALLNAARTLGDWRISRTPQALGHSPEGELLLEALRRLDALSASRKPLREWIATLDGPAQPLVACGTGVLAAAPREALQRWGARPIEPHPVDEPVHIATADDDDHELELVAGWCRDHLERNPAARLLIVDARLRARRGLYDRILSQTLSPSEWLAAKPRAPSQVHAVEGGRPLADFPVIAHAMLTLRLLTGRLRFDEVIHWLRLPFLDGDDTLAGAAVEAVLRQGRKLELTAEELAFLLERAASNAATALVIRLRRALATLSGERRSPSEWSPRLLQALQQLGWHGTRALRSDEQQTVARWHALLDEYASLGAWLPRAAAAEAVATLADLAAERYFDPASVDAPITLTESHDDPVVRYDAIWVAGLDAAQWPPPPRPDVFIPLRLQTAAAIPWASAIGQAQVARRSLAAWRAAADSLTCSWARLEGDAHRSISPLLARIAHQTTATARRAAPLAQELRQVPLEEVADVTGRPVDTRRPVAGGVTPLTLQAECGFHAYAQVRLAAEELEEPAPGIDARERGMLLHKALELVWIKLKNHFHLSTSLGLRKPLIADSVEAAVAAVFGGFVPHELRAAVEREKHRLEVLIEALLCEEQGRPYFDVVALESRREVSIAGGRFELRIDRIDSTEGGGYVILDYKSGDAAAPRWKDTETRDPQLLAYLLAEMGRDVQALANVSLANSRARFRGKASRTGLLPGVKGLNPNKVPAEEIDAAWRADLERWLLGLQRLAADYIAGHAPVQPAADVCRNCHLTVLCRRVELASAELAGAGDE
jgi:ATP-dependent helicase/nuclease subunit B